MGSPASIFDSLYCSEEHWADFDGPDEQHSGGGDGHCLGLWGWDEGKADNVGGGGFDQDLFWDDQELVTLSSKEESSAGLLQSVVSDRFPGSARAEAVEWMMKVHSYYGFSAPTAVLAVNYLDRFLSKFHCEADDENERSLQQMQQQQQPWVTQLTAVACLSLAAKVEETQVPLLLDLQVDETRDLFDAKTVRKMELLVLSTLQWRMNPVTPLSFLDHFARRLGLKGHFCRDFIRRSELVLLQVIPDPRFLRYLPSAMAAAVMLHIVESFDPSTKAQYLDLLSGVILGIKKGIMDECRDLVSELAAQDRISSHRQHHSNKRKYGAVTTQHIPGSPRGVADVCFSCPSSDSECSSDSWSVMPVGREAASPAEALPKKSRTLCSFVIKE
ncbi:hypothetical protein MLD38_000945 [Melastoma candidum]|uniref:Uncharacterized protein n=1 Tax=Melastoma candidum TaxID=119954 RepID=A0ACB9SBP5_9MYRT|nr:hypothetical protein MLD38_000945 [Melastoma candidum]